MRELDFQVIKKSSECGARLGRFETARGVIETPVFMPVGTQATVKAATQEELRELGYDIILGNTYHLYLRPGQDVIKKAGGLHYFMNWGGSILTDSGGFQVFSLSDLRRIGSEGVVFKSHIDGSSHEFTPERVMGIQEDIGADIVMAFDECAPYPSTYEYTRDATRRTHDWAVRSKNSACENQAMFGIVQGGMFHDLREWSAEFTASLDLPGNAIGGVSVGEPKEQMLEVVGWSVPFLQEDRPRYLMGVGTPVDLIDFVMMGMDMFDCVLPTRLGRNGSMYTSRGRVNIKNSKYIDDFSPLDPDCGCGVCRNYCRAYLRHLYMAGEILAARMATFHNLFFYQSVIRGIREAILADNLAMYRKGFLEKYEEEQD